MRGGMATASFMMSSSARLRRCCNGGLTGGVSSSRGVSSAAPCTGDNSSVPRSSTHTIASSSSSTIVPAATSGGKASSLLVDEHLYDYVQKHTRESPGLHATRARNAHLRGAHMAVTADVAGFLKWLVETTQCRRCIEVGVLHGYSTLAIAEACFAGDTRDACLIACESDDRAIAVAKQNFEAAGFSDRIDVRAGPASATLQSLLDDGGEGQFDFIFVDADKRGYDAYFELGLQLVRRGGIIAFDNVLWYGRVADDAATTDDKRTVALRALNAKLLNDMRISYSLLSIGDGLALCTKR